MPPLPPLPTAGLGYSAIACARLGAKRVISLEIDPRVIDVARQNPLSAELFTSEAITIMMGPAQDTVRGLPDEAFSAVLHDPPRFSHAGELYSQVGRGGAGSGCWVFAGNCLP